MTENKIRCEWVEGGNALYYDYHDKEWGVPVHDDRLLFEFLTLEAAQAGLSWATILNKREGYRKAFDNFDVERVANYSEEKIAQLLENPGIVRNKLKVNATVINAGRILEMQKEFGSFDAYIWQFSGGETIHNQWKTLSEVPAKTTESDAMSKDLKKRGFKFIGTTICYAFMQATGMVNDHTVDCFLSSRRAKRLSNALIIEFNRFRKQTKSSLKSCFRSPYMGEKVYLQSRSDYRFDQVLQILI